MTTAIRSMSSPRELVPPRDRPWRMLIDGKLVPAASGEELVATNPATGEPIGRFPSGAAEDVDRAVAAAKRAFPDWRALPATRRAACVLKLADAIEACGEELAVLDTLDNGSPIAVMRSDYKLAIEQMRYFAGLALQLRGDTIPAPTAGALDFTVMEPFGVVARIVPFNHPLMFAASKLAAPLVAGNTIVLKPSADTSLSALRLGELIADVFPPGVANVVSGTGSVVGERLVRHPDVRRIGFTGSVEVGQGILRSASEVAVKTVSLELGGKNPCIVFADADREAAVRGALRGMNFTWQGQSCGSTSRLYVHRSLFDAFVRDLGAAMDAMRIGDPLDEATEVGPVVSRRQYDKVRQFVDLGCSEEGTRLLAGGPPKGGTGYFVRPTLFAIGPDSRSKLATEEIFGPVLVAAPFDDYDEVIARANALPLGLTASVWTASLAVAMRAARDLEAGYVWVNASSSHIPGTPFGGQKQSGAGREEGIEELYSYTQAKNVFVQYGKP